MGAASSHLLICSCERTMPLDAQAIGRGCAGKITQVNQLCGLELERFKEALAEGAPVTVACTQEAPLFREVAENVPQAQLTFANIREPGGWSNDARAARGGVPGVAGGGGSGAPGRATARAASARLRTAAGWWAAAASRVAFTSRNRVAPVRAPRSLAARAGSTCVRAGRSRQTAMR